MHVCADIFMRLIPSIGSALMNCSILLRPIPPIPWLWGNSLPLPFRSLSPPFHPFRPLRSRPLPFPIPLEVAPHCGWARPPNVFWWILGINLHHFDCLLTNNNFHVRILFIKRMFLWYIWNSLPRSKKRFRAHNLAAVGGNCQVFLGDSPPKNALNKHRT